MARGTQRLETDGRAAFMSLISRVALKFLDSLIMYWRLYAAAVEYQMACRMPACSFLLESWCLMNIGLNLEGFMKTSHSVFVWYFIDFNTCEKNLSNAYIIVRYSSMVFSAALSRVQYSEGADCTVADSS